MSARAEALVCFQGAADETALAVLGKRTGVAFEARPGSVRILASSEGAGIEALTAAALAALALVDALKDETASIESIRLAPETQPAPAERSFISRGSLNKEKTGGPTPRPKPRTLMGEVSAPRPAPDNAREAFRAFMTSHRLRPSSWAKDAGVHSGEILGYLTGRSRALSAGVAEKLARAAKVRVEDMFR